MSFHYALEFSVKGNNPDIKDAISIQFINPPPPFVCGQTKNNSMAQGNFRPRFIVSDPGQKQSANALTDLASNHRVRQAEYFKITRYTIMEGEVVPDYEIEFDSHYILVFLTDDKSGNKNHAFELVASQPRAEILHTAYKLGDPSTAMRSTAYLAEYIRSDLQGYGIIVPDIEV